MECRLVVWVTGDGVFHFLLWMPPLTKGVTARITLNGKEPFCFSGLLNLKLEDLVLYLIVTLIQALQ